MFATRQLILFETPKTILVKPMRLNQSEENFPRLVNYAVGNVYGASNIKRLYIAS